ncbi:hypothetical protein FA95DRAFT_1612269 [Auriscalpium vulgare]|uniref:Uncharacterized protein n=1 Tax=Auriscalpium vulgare TaxID=40419 RepID=A0ACB8R8C7_9AGAM|nr:hypothetical protein FA95DRAFT_1612269 [Auriscalpium vulgare]
MITVPLDVQIVVIDWVYRLSQHSDIDYSTLCACALVCRAWTTPAQRLLFRRVSSHHAIAELLDTLRNAPHLAKHVRFIEVGLDTTQDETQLAILELCTNLDGISIYVFDKADALDATVEARLHAAQLQPVFLELDAYHNIVESIVRLWPSICTLSVYIYDQDLEFLEEFSEPLPEIPETVQSMSIIGDQVGYLAKANFPPLRELELNGPSWRNTSVCEWLHEAGVLPHLQSLRIVGELPPHEVLMQLMHLENLVFTELPVGEAVISLPPTLIRVAYLRRRYRLSIEHAKDAKPFLAALRTLPKLQQISVTPRSSAHELTMFNEVCRERGIELEMYQSADHFWGPQNVDWI